MSNFNDFPFFNYDVQNDFGHWTALNEPMLDPISRPPSTRAQMLYGIGAGTCLHLDTHHTHSPYLEPFELESHRIPENAFHTHQKIQDVTFPPFEMGLSHEGYQHDSPRSDDSSQSGDTFSASCYTDDLSTKAMHHRLSINSPPLIQEPYFNQEFLPTTQSPQLPPGLGGGISLGEVQNFQDQIMDRNQEFQDSAYSEPDAEGESDHDYPSVAIPEPLARRPFRPERVYKDSFAESTQDSMSEDFDPKEEEADGDYNPRSGQRAGGGRNRRAPGGRRASNGRRAPNGMNTGRITKSKTRKPSNASLVRPFPCPLAQYGCLSTFTSKNEWKRHMSTQHIKLGFWRCDMCPPADPENPVYNDFNRKDLFTQHLRRMHRRHPLTISTIVNDKGEPEISDEAIQAHQERCYVTLRDNPADSTCLFCDKEFHGESGWEERMEHVGGHMEKERKANKPVVPCEDWHEDISLRDYLEHEGLIRYDNGKWDIGDGRPLAA
jgi:hypothetical protein